jgi:predicted aspartyl protease
MGARPEGGGMGWIATGSAALIATAAVPVVDEIAAVTQAADVEVLDLNRERYNRLTVPVTIGEHGPFNFMIDTGAQATVLSLDLADRLGFHEREPAVLIGMASRKPIEVTRLHDLALGNRVFDIETAPLVEQANIGAADGILGLDSLQEQRVLLDFEGRTIAVADAETLGGNGGFEIVVRARRELGQLIITSASLDGIRVNVLVDTGAQGSVGNLELQRRLRGRDSGTTEMTDINGVEVTSNLRLARDVRIGRAQLQNVPIAFIDSPTFKALGLDHEPAMVLGMNELKLFRRVAIDFKERKVLFDMPRGSRNRDFMGSVITF